MVKIGKKMVNVVFECPLTKVTIKWEPTQLILSSEKFAFHKEVFALDLKNSEGFSPLLTLALWIKVDK